MVEEKKSTSQLLQDELEPISFLQSTEFDESDDIEAAKKAEAKQRIKIVTGSDTGNTENIAKDIARLICLDYDVHVDIIQVHEITPEDWDTHNFYILGAPTWFDGECSQDWNWYLTEFQQLDFTGKKIGLYGLGDQEGYPDYYNDAIGILAKIIKKNQGELIGTCNVDEDQHFNKSEALIPDQDYPMFYGCALDEDNQPHLTPARIATWIRALSVHF